MKKTTLLFLVIFFLQATQAQIKKYGKISKDEFAIKDKKEYKEDDAIVLFKKRETYFDFSQNQGWFLVTKVHERILLKNKEGFKYATKTIPIYKREKASIHAATYNLVNGKVIKTKLENDDIFKQEINNEWSEKKFTMPNLKEGSIIEWKYRIISPYFSIDDIIYQNTIPILYLDAKVTIPKYFRYRYYMNKYTPVKLNIKEGKSYINIHKEVKTKIFSVHLKNVEPLKEEPYISHINNYIGRVQFDLASINFPNSIIKTYSSTWEDVCNRIYSSDAFGSQLKKTGYFKKDLEKIISPSDSDEMKIKKIVDFIKKKIRWNERYRIYADKGVVRAYKSGKGNVAEINFILISMFNQAGLEAYPVLGSTVDHGIPLFPTIKGFNYILTAVKKDGGYILIDPTENLAPPGVLPSRILNWYGRIVKKDGTSEIIELFPQYYSMSVNTVNASVDGSTIKGYTKSQRTANLALHSRNILEGLNKEQIIEKLSKEYENTKVLNARVTHMKEIEKPLGITYQFEMEEAIEEVGNKSMFYPALFFRTKENYFKSDKRKFPIYFAYPKALSYIIDIHIPESYKIQKLPENASFNLPENMGSYTYKIQQTPRGIRLQIEIKISQAVIPVTRYKELKDFFEKIVSKENEPVILSK